MSDWTELLEVNSDRAFKFFFERLWDEVPAETTNPIEAMYVASVLAHHALTSRYETAYMSPGSLYNILDMFVLPGPATEGFAGLWDPELLETAGSHTLLLVGFFRDQVKKRHNLGWYEHLGSVFFTRAGNRLENEKRAKMLKQVGTRFPFWAASCCKVSRTLREERLLLRLDS